MTAEWEIITDPEKLFHLSREGWEIEVDTGPYWETWRGAAWMSHMSYRARPRRPKVVTKKLCAWVDKHLGGIEYRYGGVEMPTEYWSRQPHLDLEGRFEE